MDALNIDRPIFIDMPTPKLGGKMWLLDRKGTFVLEQGPCCLGTIACTSAGAGGLIVYDGVPDEGGNFSHDADIKEGSPEWFMRPGREVHRMLPIVMGSWWLNGGCYHGLTLRVLGGHPGTPAIATVVWTKAKP